MKFIYVVIFTCVVLLTLGTSSTMIAYADSGSGGSSGGSSGSSASGGSSPSSSTSGNNAPSSNTPSTSTPSNGPSTTTPNVVGPPSATTPPVTTPPVPLSSPGRLQCTITNTCPTGGPPPCTTTNNCALPGANPAYCALHATSPICTTTTPPTTPPTTPSTAPSTKTQTCPDGGYVIAPDTCPTAPSTKTQICIGGYVIASTESCPTTPPEVAPKPVFGGICTGDPACIPFCKSNPTDASCYGPIGQEGSSPVVIYCFNHPESPACKKTPGGTTPPGSTKSPCKLEPNGITLCVQSGATNGYCAAANHCECLNNHVPELCGYPHGKCPDGSDRGIHGCPPIKCPGGATPIYFRCPATGGTIPQFGGPGCHFVNHVISCVTGGLPLGSPFCMNHPQFCKGGPGSGGDFCRFHPFASFCHPHFPHPVIVIHKTIINNLEQFANPSHRSFTATEWWQIWAH